MINRFINIPKRGDIVLRDIATKSTHFIQLNTFDKTQLDQSQYEILGVVYNRTGNEVKFLYKNNASYKYCSRAWWYLSGYTLDGTDRTGSLSIRAASDSWVSNLIKTIPYNATNVNNFITQLNTYFSSDYDLTEQDWYANLESDGRIRLHCNNIDYRQCAYNTAISGFTLTGALPEIPAVESMRRKNGNTSGWGAISSYYRALSYYKTSVDSAEYQGNAINKYTTPKSAFPVSYTSYMGSNASGVDNCEYLRNLYGANEEGWKNMLKSCLAVHPINTGNMSQKFGKEMGLLYGNKTYTSSKTTTATSMMPAFYYAYHLSGQTFSTGEFWVPTVEDLALILEDIQYGTNSSRDSDILNQALNKIGGSAINNSSLWWSCCRYYSNDSWYSYGTYGIFLNHGMSYTCGVLPVSLYSIS